MVESVAGGAGRSEIVEYVWLDVFCIDQKNPVIKAEEIGRQALIFERATEVYIWLLSFSGPELEATLKDLLEIGSPVSNRLSAIQRIILDPWCSSLWTLQEAFLRSHAILLSRDAQPVDSWEDAESGTITTLAERYFRSSQYPFDLDNVRFIGPFPISLSCFMDGISVIFNQQHISAYISPNLTGIDPDTLRNYQSKFEKAGFRALDHRGNPFLVYTSAISRRPGEENDCIYAIMQIYELFLGASNDSAQHFTLLQLESQLIDGFLSISLFYSQFFVHTKPAPKGKSWRMNETSIACSIPISNQIMPYKVSTSYRRRELLKDICLRRDLETGHLIWSGQRCGMIEMVKYWASALDDAHLYTPVYIDLPHPFTLSIQLDALSPELIPEPPESLLPATCEGLVQMMDRFGRCFDLSRMYVLKIHRVFVIMGATDEKLIATWAGVIAYELKRDHNGETRLQRLGVCVWDQHSFSAGVNIQEVAWRKFFKRM
jgi:hypothetical protein